MTVGTPIRYRLAKKKMLSYRMERVYETLRGYAEAHDGRLPPAERWCDELMEYDVTLSKDIFRDGFNEDEYLCHMAFNPKVSGSVLSGLHSRTIILFGAKGDWNLNGWDELLTETVLRPYLLANGAVGFSE
jgi:hypothetical protein